MNRRFTPIDARICGVTRRLAGIGTQTRVALQHCPGEGLRGSS